MILSFIFLTTTEHIIYSQNPNNALFLTVTEMQMTFDKNEEIIVDMSDQVSELIRRMNGYTADIVYWAQFARQC